MFFQTLLQTLMGKKREASRAISEKELSPLAQSIMQKLAEHEKNSAPNSMTATLDENMSKKSDS
jgi:hypothetical protein